MTEQPDNSGGSLTWRDVRGELALMAGLFATLFGLIGLFRSARGFTFGEISETQIVTLCLTCLVAAAGLTVLALLLRYRPKVLRHTPAVASAMVITGAVIFRILLVQTQPALSDDIWRYIHDGRMLSGGGNPYLMSPQEALDASQSMPETGGPVFDDGTTPGMRKHDLLRRINNPDLVTIYQPTSQWVFFVGALLGGRGSAPETAATAMRLVFVAIDLAIVGLLIWLLVQAGRSPMWAALYAWHPLAIVEVAHSGHQDVIGIALLLLALGISGLVKRPGRPATDASEGETTPGPDSAQNPSEAAYGAQKTTFITAFITSFTFVAAAAVKPIILPVALPVFWIWRKQPRAIAGVLAGGIASAVVLYLPFVLMPGGITRMLETGRTFVDKWAFNSIVQQPLAHATSSTTASAIVIAILLLAIVSMIRRRFDLVRIIGWYFVLALLLSSTVHPWYLLWALAFVPLCFNAGTWVWSATIFVSYFTLVNPDGYRVPGVWLVVEYLPVVVAVALQLIIDLRYPRPTTGQGG